MSGERQGAPGRGILSRVSLPDNLSANTVLLLLHNEAGMLTTANIQIAASNEGDKLETGKAPVHRFSATEPPQDPVQPMSAAEQVGICTPCLYTFTEAAA